MIKRILEKQHVENPTVKWAKDQGIRSTKNNGMGQRSWPDRTFWIPAKRIAKITRTEASYPWHSATQRLRPLPDAKPFLIEFKRPGEEPTPLQWETIMWLRASGYDVEVHDSKETAIAAIKLRMKT